MTSPPIVLLTDFGLADAYVGMMRGVIASINPAAAVIDLTHGIAPQDVRHGAVVLADSHRYFPTGSVFVAVVDPGVGTDRAAIVLETPDARFVAPDNGLLTLVCREFDRDFGHTLASGPRSTPSGCRAWRLSNADFWRTPVSATFHGRDVFAPVAAHLSRGVAPDLLGEPATDIVELSLPEPKPEGNVVRGQTLFADNFGNLVTDVTVDILDGMGAREQGVQLVVSIAGHRIEGLARSFHDPPGAGLRALVGSHGRLEVVVVDGSAATLLGNASGAPVEASVEPDGRQ